MARLLAVCLIWLVAGAGGVRAQDDLNMGTAESGPVRSPVLTIDPDVLFERSLFGQRVMAEVEAQTTALATENRRIEQALTEEEQSLTDRRPNMAVSAFREEAAAFDERVQAIRQAQDAKERALEQIEIEGRDNFLNAAQPVLGRLMLERGAAVILDRRSVFLGFGAIDVTEAALEAINAEIGDGTGPVATDPGETPELDPVPDMPEAQEPAPQPEPTPDLGLGEDAAPAEITEPGEAAPAE